VPQHGTDQRSLVFYTEKCAAHVIEKPMIGACADGGQAGSVRGGVYTESDEFGEPRRLCPWRLAAATW